MAAVVDEAGIRGGEVINDGTARVAQQNVSAAVTVEIASARDMPAIVDSYRQVAAVVDETTIRSGKIIDDGAVSVAQQYVGPTVPVEVARADDLPTVVDHHPRLIAIVG